MAGDNPPQKPKERSERREQANRIAEISHRISDIGANISTAVRSISNDILGLRDQIKTDNKATDTREKEYYDRSIFWIKRGTIASIMLTCLSLAISCAALYVVDKQLNTMRIEQRAWIKIEQVATRIEENKPLIADLVIKNIGKTPAKRVDGNFVIKIVNREDAPDLRLVGSIFVAFSGLLNPDGVIPVPVTRLGKENLLNPRVLTNDEFVKFRSGEAYIVVFGRLTYFDIYGTSHWIDFCAWPHNNRPGTYSSKDCIDYNNVDDN